jgi:uncharacterized membrane protein
MFTRTTPLEESAVVAVYDTHTEAEAAIRELQKSGFDMKKLSIIGKDYQTDQEVTGYYNTGDRMMKWGGIGAFWGGLWSMLFGSALFLIPGVGPILIGGPLVAWIVAVLEGAVVVGGLSALGGALFSIGIPKDSILTYETQIKAGKYVVIAHDEQGRLDQAMEILGTTGHKGIERYSVPSTNA